MTTTSSAVESKRKIEKVVEVDYVRYHIRRHEQERRYSKFMPRKNVPSMGTAVSFGLPVGGHKASDSTFCRNIL
jgi:hypothetical protein